MSNGLLKAHHGIMAQTAKADYEVVRQHCENNGLPETHPKGKHWHKIEDATKEMLVRLDWPNLNLNRGIDYYKSILPATTYTPKRR